MPVAMAKMLGSKMMSSRREADFVDQQVIGARADLDLAFQVSAWPCFVEGHHHHGRAVTLHLARLLEERGFAFLERDRVDDGLALHALQAGFDHAPLRRVDHHRHARDVGFGGDQVQELRHRRFGVEQALVHVDVDDLRAVLDLLARDLQRLVVAVFLDQLPELRRAGDIGALADVDEVGCRRDHEGFEAGQARVRRWRGQRARRRRRAPRRRSRRCARAWCRSSRRRC